MTSNTEKEKNNKKNENELLLRLSKTLTSVSPTSRKKGLDIISRYIVKNNDSITQMQMLKLWKGLYYSMWLSDKVLIQREIAINIAQLQRKFTNLDLWLCFIEEFYLMMRFRWDNIDHYRIDKFTFLQRTMLAESLEIISKKNFENKYVKPLFRIFSNCLFIENSQNKKNMNNKRKHSVIEESDFDEENQLSKQKSSSIENFTGIGVSLIFCKQFPQELIYLLYEQYKLLNNDGQIENSNNNNINSFFNEYSLFIINLLEYCHIHSTLIEYIHSQLILRLLDSKKLLDEVLKDIEDLNLTQEEKELINKFIKRNIIKLMAIIQGNMTKLARSKDNSINSAQRNRIYNTLEKIGEFLSKDQEDISINLPKTSRNKMKNISIKQDLNEDQIKKVRFDMSKNVRMLLPDSISTSKVLMKMFDKKNSKRSNELNCVLFKSKSQKELSNNDDFDQCNIDFKSNANDSSDNLRSIEIVSVEEALSKPSESSSSPSKSILRVKNCSK